MIEQVSAFRLWECMDISRRSLLTLAATAGLSARPRQSKQRQRELSFIQNFLASHGLPPAQPGVLHQRNGWISQLRDDRFILARVLGERPAPAEINSGRGELTWFHFADRAWRAAAPKVRLRPDAPQSYFPSHALPEDWAAGLLAHASRESVYYYTVRHCEFTPIDSEEASGPVTWELPDWFENALVCESQFKASR